jgi:adenylosuccinate synthase
VQPIYETMPGWKQDLSQIRRWDDLPHEARQYVKRLETLVGAPIKMVSVGSERTATLIRE